MTRLFVAIEVPASLRERAAALAARLPDARPVRSENLHLTLRFIGDPGSETVGRAVDERLDARLDERLDARLDERLDARLDEIAFAPFTLVPRGFGAFPARGRPRVAWIGFESSPALSALHEKVDRAVVATGVAAEPRPFRPHLTIARFRGAPASAARQFMRDHDEPSGEPFLVSEIVLFESELRAEGARHRARMRYPARG